MTAARWAAGHLARTEALLRWLSTIRCPAHFLETSALPGNKVEVNLDYHGIVK